MCSYDCNLKLIYFKIFILSDIQLNKFEENSTNFTCFDALNFWSRTIVYICIYMYIYIYIIRKVAGSIPAGVSGFFIDIKSF